MSKTHELHSICAMVPPDTGPPDWSLFVSSLEETATEARDTAAGEAKADDDEAKAADAETRGRELLRITAKRCAPSATTTPRARR